MIKRSGTFVQTKSIRSSLEATRTRQTVEVSHVCINYDCNTRCAVRTESCTVECSMFPCGFEYHSHYFGAIEAL